MTGCQSPGIHLLCNAPEKANDTRFLHHNPFPEVEVKGFRFTMAIAAMALVTTACSESLPTEAVSDVTPSYAKNPKADASGNKLQCFEGQGDGWGSEGTCELITNGASINTLDTDGNIYNNYAGVYIPSNLGGRLLSDVNKLSFSYDGSGAAGGSPRISLPIDINGDGFIDDINEDGYADFAFIDTMGCNDGDTNVGTLDAINDPTCIVWYNNVSYDNWAAFVAANPTYRIASDRLTFIIVDAPGEFDITNVQLGKATAKARG